MNIYTQKVNRLSCFSAVTADPHVEYTDETYQEGGYFYGDATAYELQLDKVLKQLNSGTIPQNTGIIFKQGDYAESKFNPNTSAFIPAAPLAAPKMFGDLPKFKLNAPSFVPSSFQPLLPKC